jgi:hypothetical protein
MPVAPASSTVLAIVSLRVGGPSGAAVPMREMCRVHRLDGSRAIMVASSRKMDAMP